MSKSRLEAFSDGVLAIIITIMVLEMSAPTGNQWADLRPVIPTFFGYLISYLYIGIYWVNHHRLLLKTKYVCGLTLFTNLFWMFCVSLIPFATAWTSRAGFKGAPGALYSITLLVSAVAYHFLVLTVEQARGRKVTLFDVMIKDRRSLFTIVVYAITIPLAYVHPLISYIMYVLVMIFWILTDSAESQAMNEKMKKNSIG
jgi:uncharacterized membrane protein